MCFIGHWLALDLFVQIDQGCIFVSLQILLCTIGEDDALLDSLSIEVLMSKSVPIVVPKSLFQSVFETVQGLFYLIKNH